MGIGFVIMFWFLVFTVLTAIYFFLHSLAKDNEGAAELKRAFLALSAIGLTVVFTLFAFTIGNVCLDYFYPSRIFTKNFNFEPTADVRIIEGSSFWTPLGYSTHLKFQANEQTIQKIVLEGFVEPSKNQTRNYDSDETKSILKQPQSRYFEKSGGDIETLAYDKQRQNAYFSFRTAD